MPITTAVISTAGKAATSLINNTVDNLFNAGVKKAQIRQIDAQIAAMDAKTKLDQLSNQQKNELAAKLQKAQTETERFQIMNDMLSSLGVATVQSLASGLSAINVAKVNQASTQQITLAVIVIGGAFLALGAIYLIKKKS